jgi:hypothetical protein
MGSSSWDNRRGLFLDVRLLWALTLDSLLTALSSSLPAKIVAAVVTLKGDIMPYKCLLAHHPKRMRMYIFRPRRDDRERRGPPLGRRPPGFRIFISGLSRDTSWQVCISRIPFTLLGET